MAGAYEYGFAGPRVDPEDGDVWRWEGAGRGADS